MPAPVPRCSLELVLASAVALACAPSSTSAPVASVSSATPTTPEGAAPVRWSYTIGVDAELARMQLGLCIEGARPLRLKAGPEALDFVRRAEVRGGPALERSDQGLLVSSLGDQGCLDLEIDLEAAVEAEGRDSIARGDTLMVAPDRWLWYPAKLPDQLEARVRFELPEGVEITGPWPEREEGWRELERTSFGWNGWVALGRYAPLEFEVGACAFEVAILEGAREASDAGIEAWIRTAAEASVELYGRFPRERVAVVVIPYAGWGAAPVFFGMARRGGGGSAMLLLNQDAEDEALIGEWVAAHELLHLGMPLVADPWMSEGFVTYYTQVLRARQGVLVGGASHEQQVRAALQALHQGFRKGRGGVQSLAHASDNMGRLHSYNRVYWGGAAIAFELDVAIREASGGRRSLDDLMCAMGEFAPVRRRWQSEELVARMDEQLESWRAAGELAAKISCASIVERHLEARRLPDDIELLTGVAVEAKGGEVKLLDGPGAQQQVRAAMFEPRSAKL